MIAKLLREYHMTSFKCAAVAIGCLSASMLGSCGSDAEKTETAQPIASEPAKPLTVERSVEGRVRAKVRAIDLTTRVVTLEDERGHVESFIVGPEVKRLHEVLPGDYVDAAYSATLTAELRPPTAEEAASPITAVEVGGRATKPSDPAGTVGRGVRVVTTVEAIDLPNMRVTLRGPMGDHMTVRARNPENVKKLRIGDTIVITYVEAVAVSLEKTM
jgi:hypothetical protein